MEGQAHPHEASHEGNIHVHFAKKTHGHQQATTTTHHVDTNPEVYCITRDGRMLVFKLESKTTLGVGDFASFTRKLQVWIPFRCESCGLTQFMDMGVAYADEDYSSSSSNHTVDSGRARIYGGRFACPSCSAVTRVEIKFEYYASSARFSKETAENAKIIHLAGAKEFFKAAKNSANPDYNSESKTQQGSLMHFG